MKILFVLFLSLSVLLLSSSSVLAITQDYNSTCMTDAVLKRESAIAAAYQKFISDSFNSFQKRTEGLLNAYSIVDSKERKKAISEVWKTYKTEYKIAVKELKEARKLAWKEFKNDKLICRFKENLESETDEIKL